MILGITGQIGKGISNKPTRLYDQDENDYVSRRYQMVMVVGEGNVIITLHDED